ncbi:MAG: glycosyltransferase family 4 protein [Candidatus Rokubacteria bacterium]|nr:glycosyltransferase family 4 protein [Candidatus Rokubacteria bacterium]
MKVLCLVPYPTVAPSNRLRVEQYLPALRARGIQGTVRPFIDSARFYALSQRSGQFLAKAAHFLAATARRLADLRRADGYDLVLVHREAFPVGPAWVESWLTRRGIPLVYDFDDAIYLPHSHPAHQLLRWMKAPGKVVAIIRQRRRIIAGNSYLAAFARHHNPRVVIIPTPVDTDRIRPVARAPRGPVTLGWMGTATTAPYLGLLDTVWPLLGERERVALRVVGGSYRADGIGTTESPWTLEGEAAHLQAFDIGLAPMPDTAWTRGKCAFKVIQYMAAGLPVIASPVGAQGEVVRDGVTGFFATTAEEWVARIQTLVRNPDLRREMGMRGRALVENEYSLRATLPRFATALEEAGR